MAWRWFYQFVFVVAILPLTPASGLTATPVDDRPNIVVILADDLGYGDVRPNNAGSRIPTPNFERLAKEGMNFSDAHSGSGVCTPTRYGLLCGRYCWRTRLKRGVLGGYSQPLIADDQPTIASMLKQAGYHTCCIGKWHLGLGWQWNSSAPENIDNFGIAGKPRDIDYSKPITNGPTNHGFDTCFVIPASLDMSPYVYIADNRVTQQPSENIDGEPFPKFYRRGDISSDFHHVECLDRLADEASQYIASRASKDSPFFLYFAMPAPHKPVIPSAEFRGKTELGVYGDFVSQVDATVGQILDALDEAKIADHTLLIVTSDNGSFMHRYDEPGTPDHVQDNSIQGYQSTNHTPNGPLRGTKADIYEAGHRVPFFCRWIDVIPPSTQSSHTICLTDILATAAEVAECTFDQHESPDSFSFLSSAKGQAESDRPPVIHHSAGGMFAIRDGNWKLILGNGSGGRQNPKGKPFEKPFQLYNLAADLGEQNNLFEQRLDVADKLIEDFESIAGGDQIDQ